MLNIVSRQLTVSNILSLQICNAGTYAVNKHVLLQEFFDLNVQIGEDRYVFNLAH